MTDLVKVKEVNGVNFVGSLKELYTDVGMDKSNWSRWLKKNVEDNLFFSENLDYQLFVIKTSGRDFIDCSCTLDMAKHLVIQMPTDDAHRYRKYLIDYEKKSPLELLLSMNKENLAMTCLQLTSVIKEKDELIEIQSKEIIYKEDVIIGLVDEITLEEKRQTLNKVVKHKGANYKERWQLLYKHFEDKYHLNLKIRKTRWDEVNKPKSKSMVDFIDRGLGKIPELYEIATKLFEGDIKEIISHYEDIR